MANSSVSTLMTGGALSSFRAALRACFAAGTPLLTPEGSKPIEDILPGDVVLARSEDDPNGAVEPRVVEEVFVRTGMILHLGVQGQTIRTKAEHPFFVKGKGWIPAGELEAGDLLSTHDGQWVAVEGVADSGEYTRVYNLRVADYHTYFVGCPQWGWSAWAHNAKYNLTLQDVEQLYRDSSISPPLPRNQVVARALMDEVVSQVDLHLVSSNHPQVPRSLANVFDDLPDRGAGVHLSPTNTVSRTKRQGILIVDGEEYYLGSGQTFRTQTPTTGGHPFTEGLVNVALERVATTLGFRNTSKVGTALGNGFENLQASHVEHQVALILRRIEQLTGKKLQSAQLLINDMPCPPPVQGCNVNLNRMLPEGTPLGVWVGSRSNKPTQPLPPYLGIADE